MEFLVIPIILAAIAAHLLVYDKQRKVPLLPTSMRHSMDILNEGILIINNKHEIIFANATITKLLKLPVTQLESLTINQLHWELIDDEENPLPWEAVLKSDERVDNVNVKYSGVNFTNVNFSVSCAPLIDALNRCRGIIICFNPVDAQNNQANAEMIAKLVSGHEKIERFVRKDTLTNCLGPDTFDSVLKQHVEEQTDKNIVFMALDIDSVKGINNRYGTQIGDLVIAEVSRVIESKLRKQDIISRYGGEEFFVLLNNSNLQRATETGERIQKACSEIQLSNNPSLKKLAISLSIGIAHSDNNVETSNDFVGQGLQALKSAKTLRPGGLVVWTNEHVEPENPLAQPSNNNTLDAITGLPIRHAYLDSISQEIEKCIKKPDGGFALLIFDINMFKRVNQKLGNAAGDLLLREISERLTASFRHSDILAKLDYDNSTICRLGGDEFGLLLSDVSEPDLVRDITKRLISTLAAPFKINETDLTLTCSVGVSSYPQDGDSVESMLKNAEIALSQAKRNGHNNYHLYSVETDHSVYDDLQLEFELAHAIENNQLELYYQPKIDLKNGGIIGFEALLRWHHPRLALLPPTKFIRIAEDIGKIHEIGAWVLEQACIQTKIWVDAGFDDIKTSVNMSMLQFKNEQLTEDIQKILTDCQISPKFLEIEITENTLIDNLATVEQTLGKLHAMGLGLSIDDFGTGYSSFSYLKRFPVDTLKIDRTFIKSIHENEDDEPIVAAIIAMGHAINMTVLAEGVEHIEQLERLQKMGCDQYQGFLYSRPVTAELAGQLLSSQESQEKSGFSSQT